MATKKQERPVYEWFVQRYTKLGYKSLNDFAQSNGLHKSSLHRYFTQQRHIPSNTLGVLCKLLKVTPNEMMKVLGEW